MNVFDSLPSLGGVFPFVLLSLLNRTQGKGDGFLVAVHPATGKHLKGGEGDEHLVVVLVDVANDVIVPIQVDFLRLGNLFNDVPCHNRIKSKSCCHPFLMQR